MPANYDLQTAKDDSTNNLKVQISSASEINQNLEPPSVFSDCVASYSDSSSLMNIPNACP